MATYRDKDISIYECSEYLVIIAYSNVVAYKLFCMEGQIVGKITAACADEPRIYLFPFPLYDTKVILSCLNSTPNKEREAERWFVKEINRCGGLYVGSGKYKILRVPPKLRSKSL